MPRETLRALDRDLERLLLAGGSVARTDDGLAARRDALARFGQQVPALGKVAEQIGRVTAAKPREAAVELLNLLALARQVRGAQAAPGRAEGELAELPPAARLDTPLGSAEIEPVFRAVALRGGDRARTVEQAVELGAVRDLRLLAPWVDALGDNGIGDVVAARVVPRLGDAALPLIEAALALDGGAADVRRLRCVAALRGRAADPLLERAVAQGSVAVRACALGLLAERDPAGTEPLARELLREDRSAEVRAAAAAALAGRGDEASLEALLAALGDAEGVRRAARAALGGFQHPATSARVLALLTPEALDVRPWEEPRAPGGKKGAKPAALTPKQQQAQQKEREGAERAIAQRVDFARGVMGILARLREPAAQARLLEIWAKHRMPALRIAAGRALLGGATVPALEALAAGLDAPDDAARGVALSAALRLVAAAAPGSYDALGRWLEPTALKKKAGPAVANAALGAALSVAGPGTDPRWAERCLALLDDPELLEGATRVLAAMGERRAIAPLLAALDGGKRKETSAGVITAALEEFREPGTAAALAEKLDGASVAARYWLGHALRVLDEPAVLPALEALRDKHAEALARAEKKLAAKEAAAAKPPAKKPGRAPKNPPPPPPPPRAERRAVREGAAQLARLTDLIAHLSRPR